MKKKLDLKILENSDMKTLEALSHKYRAIDDQEAEKIFMQITNNTEDYYEEAQVHNVEYYHRPVWRKTCSAVLSLAIVAVTVTGGLYFNSQLKNSKNIEDSMESYQTSSSVENTLKYIAITDDYKGDILGIGNWHIEKQIQGEYENTVILSFINDDTGFEFAISESFGDAPYAYLADLDNDGNYELICNYICGIIQGKPNNHAIIYRLRNGEIEAGSIIDNYQSLAEEHDLKISSSVDFSDEYSPDRNKIILTGKNIDKDYELESEQYLFNSTNMYPLFINCYTGYMLGIKNWHIEKKSITSDMVNTYFIDDETGAIFIEFTGHKDKTSVFLADIGNDQIPEVVCNYQCGDDQSVMNDHVKIYRINNGVLECGEFLSDFEAYEKENNIELTSNDDFSELYEPEKNKIILKKQGEDTEYELGTEYYHFKPVDLQKTIHKVSESDESDLD